MAPGYRFTLYRCPRADQNREYLILGVDYDWNENPYEDKTEQGTAFQLMVTCQDSSLQFRPPRVTPKPLTNGPQTAVVVGPKGEEIWTDGYGRVKVQFRWDREGKHDENSSCWIRVSHVWAGTNFGTMHVPRIGQEVIVDFINGDPDYPLVTGRVYNADEMPPWNLPAHKTQSGILTRSSMKGTPDHANMLRFEDMRGCEEIHVHAQRQLTTVVEANESRGVGGSRSTTIHKDETLVIKEGDRSDTLDKGDDSLTISMGDRSCSILQGSDALTVQLGDINISAPVGTYSVSANMIDVKGTISVKIACGASSIEMTPATLDIKSPLITINGALVKINC